MKLSARIVLRPMREILGRRDLEDGGRVQEMFDSEVVRMCAPYVPVDSHMMQHSAQWATQFGSGLVVYSTPYARRQYYTHGGAAAHSAKTQDARAGKLWFERMKADHLPELLRFAAEQSGGKV